MLTATYSLIALKAEHKNTQSILEKLQSQIQSSLHDLQNINRACLENAVKKLEQFEEYCHKRKVELYVIPAIRKRTTKADPILAELESLKSRSVELLHSLHARLHTAFDQGMVEVGRACAELELYCHHLLKRLAKEEQELFPIVRNLLPIEEWFDIAAKFLSEDANNKRRAASPGQNIDRISIT